MSKTVRLHDDIVKKATAMGKANKRSLASQIEYWCMLAETSENNSDLSLDFIKAILESREQAKQKLLEPYIFGEG